MLSCMMMIGWQPPKEGSEPGLEQHSMGHPAFDSSSSQLKVGGHDDVRIE